MHILPTPRASSPATTSSALCSVPASRSSQARHIATSASAGRVPSSDSSPARSCPYPSCYTSTASASAWLASVPAMTLSRERDIIVAIRTPTFPLWIWRSFPSHWSSFHQADITSSVTIICIIIPFICKCTYYPHHLDCYSARRPSASPVWEPEFRVAERPKSKRESNENMPILRF
jgi:hypothetical protein